MLSWEAKEKLLGKLSPKRMVGTIGPGCSPSTTFAPTTDHGTSAAPTNSGRGTRPLDMKLFEERIKELNALAGEGKAKVLVLLFSG